MIFYGFYVFDIIIKCYLTLGIRMHIPIFLWCVHFVRWTWINFLTDQFSLLTFLMMESWFTSVEFIHGAWFGDVLKGWFRWFKLFFSFIDSNDIKIMQKLSWLYLLYLWWIRNRRQQKVCNRFCTKNLLFG